MPIPDLPSAVGTADPSLETNEVFARTLEAHVQERWDAAIAGYDEVLTSAPGHVGALAHRAAIYLRNEDEAQSLASLQRLFALPDERIIAGVAGLSGPFLTIALLAHKHDRHAVTQGVLARGRELWPEDPEVAEISATVALEDGDLETAESEFGRAITLAPERTDLRSSLAAVRVRRGNLEGALQALSALIDIDPTNTIAARQSIVIAESIPDPVQTTAHLKRLIDRIRYDTDALAHIGYRLLSHSAHTEAQRAFSRALGIDAEAYRALIGAGTAALRLGDRQAANEFWTEGISRIPVDLEAILETVQIGHGLLPAEIMELIFDRAIVAAGADAARLNRVGQMARRLSHGETAVAALKHALELDPTLADARAVLLETSLAICAWSESDELIRSTITETREAIAHDRPLDIDVWNLFAIGADYSEVAAAARQKAKQIAKRVSPLRTRAGFRFEGRKRERIKLGYLCPYSWEASHTANLKTVVSRHDPGRFEVFGYTIQPWTESTFDREFRDLFQAFRHTPLDALDASARLIYEDDIDILIDSTGHFATHCMDLAAMRPAPIVVHGCAGHNIIGGADFYDYSLNDERYLPERFYSLYLEAPCMLPHTAMPAETMPIGSATLMRRDFDLPEDRFLFADFNHSCKYDPKVFAAWMVILRLVPGSLLVLGDWMSGTKRNLAREAERHGVDPERIRFVPVVPRALHLRRLQLFDLALDTFYHCGGVTTIDCLIAGLPIVTALPDRDLPLVNLSLLTAFELEDLVVESLDDYIQRAVALAQAPDQLSEIRRRMRRAQAQAPLFQADRWVRNLERGFEIMYENCLAGHDPAAFAILDVATWPEATADM